MKNDIFNGKVKPEYSKSIKFLLIFASIIFCAVATFFLLLALLSDNFDYGARIVLLIMSGVSYLAAVLYPLITVLCVRTYPKYKALAKLFIKEYALVDTVDKENQ
ncbi:MAG: hypothetical protein K2O28_06205 [Clostridia bacterium]|nr:hypothetical protein [Clostridia bacterium]